MFATIQLVLGRCSQNLRKLSQSFLVYRSLPLSLGHPTPLSLGEILLKTPNNAVMSSRDALFIQSLLMLRVLLQCPLIDATEDLLSNLIATDHDRAGGGDLQCSRNPAFEKT